MQKLYCFIFLLVISGCSGEMKKYSKLEGLRVLGVVLDKPEINAPTTVNLTPFLSYPEAADTILDVSYEACIDPGVAYGAEISCEAMPASQVLRDAFTFDTSVLGAASFYTGEMSPIALDIPEAAFEFLATQSAERQFNGIDFIIILTVTDQKDVAASIRSVKRLSLTIKEDDKLNQNPSVEDILSAESELVAFPTTQVPMSLSGPSAAESYELLTPNGKTEFSESMLVSWFSNNGEFKFSRTDATEAVDFDPQGATSGVIVAVYRDNRGGLAIKGRSF